MAVQIDVAANQAALMNSIQSGVEAYNRKFASRNQINLQVNQKAFSQPLGRITGDVKDFNAAMAASNARVIAFGASTAVLGGVIAGFKGVVNATIEVEKNLTDINRILNLSTEQLQKYGEALFDIGKKTATSFNDASKVLLEFSRQGLPANETLERTSDALTLMRLTGMSAEASVSALTATVNGFSKSALTTNAVLNKLVAVEQSFAVSARDLSEGLSRTGQAAQEAGVSIDELNALITVAQEKTARGGAVIGNALKTIFTRLQRTETLDQLENFNIQVRDIQGNILPAVTILKNFSAAYKGLADSQRAQLSEQVAGVYQVNILKALVNDLNSSQVIYNKALEKGAQATNEAAVANAELNKSSSALLTKLGNSLQSIGSEIGKITLDPLIKQFAGVGNTILEGLQKAISDKTGDVFGSDLAKGILKGIRNTLSGPGLATALFGFIALFTKSLSYLSAALPQLIGITTESQKRKQIEQAILQIMKQQGPTSQALAGYMGNQAAQANLLLQTAKQQTLEYQKQTMLAKQLAVQLSNRGVFVGTGGLSANVKARSGGFIPSLAAEEEKSGARKGGYAPGKVVPAPKNVGGIMNTAEDVKYVDGFKQPFINPPKKSRAGKLHRINALKQTGIDPYVAGGFIPNFGISMAEYLDKRKNTNFFTGSGAQRNAAIKAGVKPNEIDQYVAARFKSELAPAATKTEAPAATKTEAPAAESSQASSGEKYNFVKETVKWDAWQKVRDIAEKEWIKDNPNWDKAMRGFIEKNVNAQRNIRKIPLSIRDLDILRRKYAKQYILKNPRWRKMLDSAAANASGAAFEKFMIKQLKPFFPDIQSNAQAQLFNRASAAVDAIDLTKQAMFEFKAELNPDMEVVKKKFARVFTENPSLDKDLPWTQYFYQAIDENRTLAAEAANDYIPSGILGKAFSGFIPNFGGLDPTSVRIILNKIKNPEKYGKSGYVPVEEEIFLRNYGAVTNKNAISKGKNSISKGKNSISKTQVLLSKTLLGKKLDQDVINYIADTSLDSLNKDLDDGYFTGATNIRVPKGYKFIANKGFIPNFAYKQAVMNFEEQISGEDAVYSENPFPHIRNKSQPTFSSAISDHGGLKNALNDSIKNQTKRGLLYGGFVPNFAAPKVSRIGIKKLARPGFGFGDIRLPEEEVEKLKDVLMKNIIAYKNNEMGLRELKKTNAEIISSAKLNEDSTQRLTESNLRAIEGTQKSILASKRAARRAEKLELIRIKQEDEARRLAEAEKLLADKNYKRLSRLDTSSFGLDQATSTKLKAESAALAQQFREGTIKEQKLNAEIEKLARQYGLTESATRQLLNATRRSAGMMGRVGSAFARVGKGLDRFSLFLPMIAGVIEQMVYGNLERAEMTRSQRMGKSFVSEGLTAVGTGAFLGGMVGNVVPGVGTAVGTGVGAVAGAAYGIVRSFKAAELTVSELSEQIKKEIDLRKGMAEGAGAYINAQKEYNELMAKGASEDEIKTAADKLKTAFNAIADVDLQKSFKDAGGNVELMIKSLQRYTDVINRQEIAQGLVNGSGAVPQMVAGLGALQSAGLINFDIMQAQARIQPQQQRQQKLREEIPGELDEIFDTLKEELKRTGAGNRIYAGDASFNEIVESARETVKTKGFSDKNYEIEYLLDTLGRTISDETRAYIEEAVDLVKYNFQQSQIDLVGLNIEPLVDKIVKIAFPEVPEFNAKGEKTKQYLQLFEQLSKKLTDNWEEIVKQSEQAQANSKDLLKSISIWPLATRSFNKIFTNIEEKLSAAEYAAKRTLSESQFETNVRQSIQNFTTSFKDKFGSALSSLLPEELKFEFERSEADRRYQQTLENISAEQENFELKQLGERNAAYQQYAQQVTAAIKKNVTAAPVIAQAIEDLNIAQSIVEGADIPSYEDLFKEVGKKIRSGINEAIANVNSALFVKGFKDFDVLSYYTTEDYNYSNSGNMPFAPKPPTPIFDEPARKKFEEKLGMSLSNLNADNLNETVEKIDKYAQGLNKSSGEYEQILDYLNKLREIQKTAAMSSSAAAEEELKKTLTKTKEEKTLFDQNLTQDKILQDLNKKFKEDEAAAIRYIAILRSKLDEQMMKNLSNMRVLSGQIGNEVKVSSEQVRTQIAILEAIKNDPRFDYGKNKREIRETRYNLETGIITRQRQIEDMNMAAETKQRILQIAVEKENTDATKKLTDVFQEYMRYSYAKELEKDLGGQQNINMAKETAYLAYARELWSDDEPDMERANSAKQESLRRSFGENYDKYMVYEALGGATPSGTIMPNYNTNSPNGSKDVQKLYDQMNEAGVDTLEDQYKWVKARLDATTDANSKEAEALKILEDQLKTQKKVTDEIRFREDKLREYIRDLEAYNQTLQGRMESSFDAMMKNANDRLISIMTDAPQALADGITNAIMEATEGAKTVEDAFKDAAIAFGRELQQKAINALLSLSIAKLGSVITGSSAPKIADYFGNVLSGATNQKGGVIRAQNGMYISGGRSGDRNLALLEDGEYVLNRNAVEAVGGKNVLDKLNFKKAPRFGGRFQSGGSFSMYAPKDNEGAYTGDIVGQSIGEDMFSAYALEEDEFFKQKKKEVYDKMLQDEMDTYNKKVKDLQLITSIMSSVGGLMLSGAGGIGAAAATKAAAKAATPALSAGLNAVATGVQAASNPAKLAASLSNLSSKAATGITNISSKISGFMNNIMGAPAGTVSTATQSMSPALAAFTNAWGGGGSGKRQVGGMIGFNSGGFVPYGSRLNDTIPALLTGGEYVMNNNAVKKYGLSTMNSMNAGAYQSGGSVSNASTTNNSTNNNSTNISINMDRSGKTTYGADSSSYKPEDIVLSKKMAQQINNIVLKSMSNEKRYGGELYKDPVRT